MKPGSLRLLAADTGITARPSRIERGVRLHDTGALGAVEELLEPLGRLPLVFADGPPHLLQFGRRRILHIAETVDDPVDRRHDLGKGAHAPGPPEERIGPSPRRRMKPTVSPTAPSAFLRSTTSVVSRNAPRSRPWRRCGRYRHTRRRESRAPESVSSASRRPATAGARSRPGRSKGLPGQPFARRTHGAERRHLLAQAVETYFLFEILRIYHCFPSNAVTK